MARPVEFSEDGLTMGLHQDHVPAFYSDCSEEDAAAASARVTPQIVAPMMATVSLSPARYGRVPSAYVVCSEDQIVDPTKQRTMAAACDTIIEVSRGHSPFWSAPDELADILGGLAE